MILGESGAVQIAKAPTTPRDYFAGVFDVIAKASVGVSSMERFMHGSTIGINTILEGKGARAGLITTRGFRDALEIARMGWPMYQLHWQQPEPLVPRHLRLEVTERLDANGTVLVPLDEDEVRRAIEELRENGVSTIAVCLLHAYAFPQHEIRIGEIIETEYPEVEYTLAHRVTSEYREWERTTTTVVDAAIRPRMVTYIDNLERGLEKRGFSGDFFVTRADGGVMSSGEVRKQSVRTLLSGPASGVMGAAALAEALEEPRMIAADMGGTSFDAALVVDREPTLSSSTVLHGLPLLMPVLEISAIGAGGGSIAWIDPGGALEVGPQSAGAEPGPVCYRKGGEEPTFTDAALISGLLDPEYFLGGDIALDSRAAQQAISAKIAEPLGIDAERAASGIVALIEAKMAALLEEMTIGRGHHPRNFVLLPYGGGGPLVASALADSLGLPKIIVPPAPANFSAWGMLMLDLVHDFARTAVRGLEELESTEIFEVFEELDRQATEAMERDGVAPANRQVLRSLDLRYDGQEHTLSIPVGSQFFESGRLDVVRERFDQSHELMYGFAMPDPVEVTTYRVRAVGSLGKPVLPRLAEGSSNSSPARKGSRTAIHRQSGGELEWDVYERDLLQAGNVLLGPAIIEEPTATTLVPPGKRLHVDAYGNLEIVVDT